MPHIAGNRIMLREYRREDLEYMRTWVNDPEVTKSLSEQFIYPHSMDKTESYLESMLEGTADQIGFVIADKETEEYIGQIDLFRTSWIHRSTEMGIVIGNKDVQSKGYGADAIQTLQRFLFMELNMNRLQLDVNDDNDRAIRCYRKCGFKEEGRLRQRRFVNGEYRDIIIMSILREEYLERIKQ